MNELTLKELQAQIKINNRYNDSLRHDLNYYKETIKHNAEKYQYYSEVIISILEDLTFDLSEDVFIQLVEALNSNIDTINNTNMFDKNPFVRFPDYISVFDSHKAVIDSYQKYQTNKRLSLIVEALDES